MRKRTVPVSQLGSPEATKESRLKELELENAELRVRLAKAEETVRTIGSGDVDGVVVSAQKEVEDALRRSEALARARAAEVTAILDTLPAITFIAYDPECRRMTSSRAALDLLGLPPGANSSLSAPPGERPTHFRAMRDGRVLPPEELPVQTAVRTGQEVRNSEIALVFDDGRVRHIFGDAVPLLDEKGKVRGAVGAFIDITKVKETERALMRSEKLAATGRLAATIAHEINNPLEAVTNLLYLIGNEPDPVNVRKFVALASAELGRVSHITRQTLGFYRDALAPQAMCITDVLDGVVSLYAKEFQKHKTACEKHYETPGEILGFAGELRQVFSNLIQNALDVVPAGGTIRIFTRPSRNRHGNGVSVFITDNGPGISRENKARIFEPFFTTKGQNGTGLGLWVASDLVHKHGGIIGVRSSIHPSRRGTCFWVFIPSKTGATHKGKATRV